MRKRKKEKGNRPSVTDWILALSGLITAIAALIEALLK